MQGCRVVETITLRSHGDESGRESVELLGGRLGTPWLTRLDLSLTPGDQRVPEIDSPLWSCGLRSGRVAVGLCYLQGEALATLIAQHKSIPATWLSDNQKVWRRKLGQMAGTYRRSLLLDGADNRDLGSGTACRPSGGHDR